MQTFDDAQECWVKDIAFVLAWLRNQPFADHLDFSHMGIFGHSFGASTALEAARKFKDFKAVANLDGMLFGQNWDMPFETPSLFVIAEKQLTHETAISAGLTIEQCDSLLARNSRKLFDQLQGSSFYVTIHGAEHASFVDSKIIKSPLSKSEINPYSAIEVARAVLVDFFDHYLRNKELTVLKEATPRFPNSMIKQAAHKLHPSQ